MTQVGTRTAAVANKIQVQSVRPCLTFKSGAEEAVNFYVSLFPNSKVLSLLRAEANGPLPEGSVLHASFRLDGQEYTAFDGGQSFTFTEAFSFVATCDTQEDLDAIWARRTEGGEEGPCGWLLYAMTAVAPDQIDFLKKAGMALTTESLVTYTEVVPRKRLAFTQMADFIPNVKPYEVATAVEFDAHPQGVRLLLTLDAMHDDYWTKMAVMRWEQELGKLAKLLNSA